MFNPDVSEKMLSMATGRMMVAEVVALLVVVEAAGHDML